MADTDTPRKGERTREDITNAAHRLFLEKGYNGTSIREIAEQAGLALGGIYNHFAGKEAIFSAVLSAHHPYHEIIPAVNAAEGDTIDDFVRDAAGRVVQVLEARPDFLNLMFIEIVEFKGRHVPELMERVLPQAQPALARFALAAEHGEIRDVPIPILLRTFLGLFVSYAVTELMVGNLPAEYRRDALAHFVDIYLYGLVVRGNA